MDYAILLIRVLTLGIYWILLKKLTKNYPAALVTFAVLFLSSFFLAFYAVPVLTFEPRMIKIAFVASMFYTVGFYLYTVAFSKGDASLMAPLQNMNVFFLLIIAILFLGEKFTLLKVLGTLVLFYGVIFLNRQDDLISSFKSVLKGPGIYMIISSFFIAVGRAIDKFSVTDFSYYVYGFYIEVFMSLFLFLAVLYLGQFKLVKKVFVKDWKLLISAGFMNIISYVSVLFALTLWEVSVVEPVALFAALVVVIMAKYVFKEKIKSRFAGTLIMIAGLLLLLL